MRAREVGKGESHSHLSCRHLSRIMYFLKCVWLSLHVHLGGD